MRPEDLFVFAGAGASMSSPTCLPSFAQIRDELLDQVGLSDYTVADNAAPLRQVARSLLPEPFLQDAERAGLDVAGWLRDLMLGRDENATHAALAELARAGARVWTVNFDRCIEGRLSLDVSSWPAQPRPDAQILKPHGSCEGRTVFAADRVLAPLGDDWRQLLAHDVKGRHVVFVGYSGNDLDFRPVWDEVLGLATDVQWFEQWTITGGTLAASDRERKESIIPSVASTGRLTFPTPRRFGPDGRNNASYDFVQWCVAEALLPPPVGVDRLFDHCQAQFPLIRGDRRLAAARLSAVLGDVPAARKILRRSLMSPSAPRALVALVRLQLTYGARTTALLLNLARVIPPVWVLGRWRAAALRKRLTILANTGRYRPVLRATTRRRRGHVSTERILRSQALRITGSLTDAATVARSAFEDALMEGHAVRTAHAAFQWALSLLWAERLDDCRRCLRENTWPFAELAANRWIAWATFTEACLLTRDAATATDALRLFGDARLRFSAEHLVDGMVSVDISRLTALRRAGTLATYEADADSAERLARGGDPSEVYYTKGSRFTQGALAIERAEYLRVHRRDVDGSRLLYQSAAESKFPLVAALGHLGLALLAPSDDVRAMECAAALALGAQIGAELVVSRATQLQLDPTATHEVFFC